MKCICSLYLHAGLKYSTDFSDIDRVFLLRWNKRYLRPYVSALVYADFDVTVVMRSHDAMVTMRQVFQIYIALHNFGGLKGTCKALVSNSQLTSPQIHIALYNLGELTGTYKLAQC